MAAQQVRRQGQFKHQCFMRSLLFILKGGKSQNVRSDPIVRKLAGK
jgi:hypothetical protein